MKKNEILEKVLGEKNDFRKMSSSELREALDKELSKSADQSDYDLIDELTKAILETEGKEPLTADVDEKRVEIQAKITKRRKIQIPKWVTALSAACVMLLCANAFSTAAWGMNIFSVVIKISEGGFTVDFEEDDEDVVKLPVSEDDPYGIIAVCAKYDIYPETPHYLPEGFELELLTSNVSDYENSVKFVFRNTDNESITLDITRYWSEVGQLGIPSDEFSISEVMVNGSPAIISKEDDQYTIIFQKGKTVFIMFTQDVDYEECDKIVASIK